MALSADQLEERRAYIGGTDAPALAGVNPPRWSQPIDVYLEKVGLAPVRAGSKMMALGQLMEQLVADLATQATGMRWRRPAHRALDRTIPAGGHLDRIAYGYDVALQGIEGQHFEPGLERALLECKWAQRRDGWGEQGTTTVPLHYAVQVQHYLAVTGRPVAILAVLLGYADFRWYRLERNPTLIAWLRELEERFWRENIVPRVPPEPDGSESYGRHLRELYAADDGLQVVATPEQALLAENYRRARAARIEAALEEAAAAQAIQRSMGTHAKLVGDGFSVSWPQNRDTVRVQWPALAAELLHRTGVDPEKPTKKASEELVRRMAQELGYTTTEPGSRPFTVHFDSDDEDERS